MDEITKDYIKRLSRHQDICGNRAEYALKRLDIVIIALSSSGLLLCFGFFKDNPNHGGGILIPTSLFVVAILTNILSQWLGFYANNYQYDWTEAEIYMEKARSRVKKKERFNIINECEHGRVLSESYTMWTNRTNLVATVSLALGILVILIEFIFLVVC